MSDAFRKFVEEKDNKKVDTEEIRRIFKVSVEGLYKTVRGWLSEYPSIKCSEQGNPTSHFDMTNTFPKSLVIKIGSSEINLVPDGQTRLGCLGSIEFRSQKGNKTLHLKSINDWKFYDKSADKLERQRHIQQTQNQLENIFPTTLSTLQKNTDLTKENFEEALQELA